MSWAVVFRIRQYLKGDLPILGVAGADGSVLLLLLYLDRFTHRLRPVAGDRVRVVIPSPAGEGYLRTAAVEIRQYGATSPPVADHASSPGPPA
jgi:hypothetical protein